MQWFQGSSLAQTIFTFVYLYDPSFFFPSYKFDEDFSLIIQALTQAINVGGYYCMDLIRRSNYLRDDDYVPSVVSFAKLEISDQEILDNLLNCEHLFTETSSKTSKL
jgi:hypothetical protein